MACRKQQDEAYSVAILCGGRSRRMGQDKAAMEYRGLPMVCRLFRAFADVPEIILSVRDHAQQEELTGLLRQYAGFPKTGKGEEGFAASNGYPKVRFAVDPIRDAGPAAGIAAVLGACQTAWLFVTAVDMPAMDAAFAEELFAFRTQTADDVQVIVPVGPEDQIHPLAAFYKKETKPLFENALAEGRYRVRDIANGRACLRIQADLLTNGAEKLQNRNTPE